MPASGPRSRGARAHPRSCQGCQPWPRASAASGLVLATQKLGGITGRGASGPSSDTCRLLARDHAAPEPTLALAKAASLGRERVRPLAWCSRPRSSAALLEGLLMASWHEAAAVAAPRPRRAPRPKPEPRAVPRRKAAAKAGVAGGFAWIIVGSVLLAGIVALNVAVLLPNIRLDHMNIEREQLRAENAALGAKVSGAASSPRIQALAKARGFVPADPTTIGYVDLTPGRAR